MLFLKVKDSEMRYFSSSALYKMWLNRVKCCIETLGLGCKFYELRMQIGSVWAQGFVCARRSALLCMVEI